MGEGFDPATIERRVRAYESFGVHRTGWPGDDRTVAWLREELAAAGLDTELQRFAFPRVEHRTARISWRGDFVDGVPMYDGGFTPYGGIGGDLCEDTDPDRFGKIVVATSALRGDRRWAEGDVSRLAEELREDGVIGVVVPSGGASGPVALRDAEHIRAPFALPVLQVAAQEVRALATSLLVDVNLEGTLEIDGERLRSNASNVTATVPGADPSAPPLLVVAGVSGWFTAAAERGTALAAWLALAEACAARSPRRTTTFLAASGAELGRLGLEAFLDGRPAPGTTWLSLGAGFGAVDTPTSVTVTAPHLHGPAATAFGDEHVEAPPVEQLDRASRRLLANGMHGVAVGAHGVPHPAARTARDTVDLAVDVAEAARLAAATDRLLAALDAASEA